MLDFVAEISSQYGLEVELERSYPRAAVSRIPGLAVPRIPGPGRVAGNQRLFAPQQNLYFSPLLQGHGA